MNPDTNIIRHLDLFSGIGGFALAAKWVGGIETIGFCEIDQWAQKVLNKNFPGIPIHNDVKTLDPKNYGRIDLISAGYPCQPFSVAGKQKGKDDDRHLWPEVFRIIKGSRPRMVLCENVAGHVNMGLDEVLSDLESEGYAAQPIVIPACSVDAPHRRDRVWIMAYSIGTGAGGQGGEAGNQDRSSSREQLPTLRQGDGSNGSDRAISASESKDGGLACSFCGFVFDHESLGKYGCPNCEGEGVEDVAYADNERLAQLHYATESSDQGQSPGGSSEGRLETQRWASESGLGRVAHGIPRRVDRLKGLGNAIVPQVAAEILRVMMTVNEQTK
jgi:DNA (cytosine-5)-methyltransferase 1